MTPLLLNRIERAFELPFVYEAQELDMQDWCETNRTDLLDDLPLGPDAWQATTSDYWDSYLFDRMSAEDRTAVNDIIDTLEGGVSEEAEVALHERWAEIEEAYEPKPSDRPDVYLPRHSCHFFLRTQAALALTLYPEREWFGVANDMHTFVVDADGEVFDLLLHDGFDPKYHYMDGEAEVLALQSAGTPMFRQAQAA
jgi:hypothetical protein